MKKIAVLISNKGTGTNLQAIIDASESKKINAKVIIVVSDTSEAEGLSRARKHNIQTALSPKKDDLIKILKKYDPDYIVLAGWKQIITDDVIDAFSNKILNLHPGLIPDSPKGEVKNPDGTKALWNKGKLANLAIKNFLDQKSTYAGSSIHLLTHKFDFGPVLERGFVKIIKGDSVESLYSRLKVKEHEIYIKALQELSLSTVLVIDGGGRGSVLVDKYQKSPFVSKVLAVPGNDLMLKNVKKPVKIFPDIETTDIEKITKICSDYDVDLVDVAQDNAVAVGVADALLKLGIQVFGPTKAAGQIEWDKAWARNFMKANDIPSPIYQICKSEKAGINFLKSQKDGEWFIKASGLAAGKGAIYAKNNKDAEKAIYQMKSFGRSGETFLIEECLRGEEFSSFAFVDGSDFIIIGHAQDHKRAQDGDIGPNTGGMGCSSPPKALTPKINNQIKLIFQKITNGLVKIKRPYRGVLYLGGMIDYRGKVYVIEFNARWGDPEAQVIVPSIKNDLYELEQQIISGGIKNIHLEKDKKYRIVVTAASKGYPNDYSKVTGLQIKGLDSVKNVQIFGAGIKLSEKKYLAGGGRLFYVMAEGDNVQEARTKAYNALSKIKVEGNNLHYRHDIGYRDLVRQEKDGS